MFVSVTYRVAKGRKGTGNFPRELRLGNFRNIPSLKLTRNVWEFTEIVLGIYGN